MSKKNVFIVLAIIVVLLIVGFLGYRYIFQSSDTSVESVKADIHIQASELLRKFENNEQEANTLYLDQVIQVSGTIGEIHRDEQYVSVTLKDPDGISGVICTFDSLSVAEESFNIGDQLTAKGMCTGYLLDVVLTKCARVEE